VETGTGDGLGMFLDNVSVTVVCDCRKMLKIDILPGKYPNKVYVKSTKYITVAILGAPGVDVTTIDPATLKFAGLRPRWDEGERKCRVVDVSGDFTTPSGAPDGYLDLNCQYLFKATSFTPNNDGTATLSGRYYDGLQFWAKDTIVIIQ
jgi:hypothetical protein